MAAFEERRDEGDHLIDMLGRAREHIWAGHPQRVGVRQELGQIAVRQRSDLDALGSRSTDDLVVDIRDVHDPPDRLPAPAKVTHEEVGEQE